MADTSHDDIQTYSNQPQTPAASDEKIMATPDRYSTETKSADQRDREDYKSIDNNQPQTPAASEEKIMATPDGYSTNTTSDHQKDTENNTSTDSRIEQKPAIGEALAWCLYEFCTYFIHAVLIPIVFPLILGQIKHTPPEPAQGWNMTEKGLPCWYKEMQLYRRLTYPSIPVGNSKFSPLEWTSISWAAGLVLANPILCVLSIGLDHGQTQQYIAGLATFVGSLFCLPVGFFRVTWIFPVYIAVIVIAITIATASHTRHHGLMIRGFTGLTLPKSQFRVRRGFSSWLSLIATAAGCLGSTIIAAFTYYMLRISDKFSALWIVSIFSGLKWLVGVVHVLTLRPGSTSTSSSSSILKAHFLSLFKHPHAVGSLVVTGLSSFTTMCIFAGAILHLVGQLCLKPAFLLYLWLTYFIFPSISMPLVQALQKVSKINAVKMQVLGFALSLITSGVGFYFRKDNWLRSHILIFAALQSTSTGVLHAFGRVLLLDCSPPGKEGAFAIWFSWVKMLGTFAGFALASAILDVSTSFRTAFFTAAIGVALLIFGNISDVGGAIAAGHISGDGDQRRLVPANGLESGSVSL